MAGHDQTERRKEMSKVELWIPVGKQFDYDPQRRIYRCNVCHVEGRLGDYHPCMAWKKEAGK